MLRIMQAGATTKFAFDLERELERIGREIDEKRGIYKMRKTTYMRELEKSEISHTNAIIQEDLHCSQERDRLFGATLWLNWHAAIGHFTRFVLTEPLWAWMEKLGSAR